MTVRSPVALPDEILGPGVAALMSARPRAASRINLLQGNYGKLLQGFRAQIAVMLARQADECKSARLPLATGDALIELAADEYQTIVDTSPTFAMGTATLLRSGALLGGVIRKGSTFRRDEDPTKIPRVRAATYEVTKDVPFVNGAATLSVPIRSQRAGAHANAPFIGAGISGAVQGTLKVADTLFDSTITVTSFEAAGGSDAVDEDAIRREAGAFSKGQYAPNKDAILAGALRGTGVRKAAVREVTTALVTVLPPTYANAAFTSVNIVDASWATSQEWRDSVQQAVANDFQGFGCSTRFGFTSNQTIAVSATVTLRDAKYLAYTQDLDATIQAALLDYFDNRPDWWTWRLAQIRAVIARADRRILTCTSAGVSDLSAGTSITEPTAPISLTNGYLLTHYMLTDNAVSVTYQAPS